MEKLEFLRNRLSKKRFVHSMNVADESYRLSFIYGENPDKAYLAGLLHDICKELPPEEQREMVMKSGLSVTREELLSPPLWHAIAGAWYVRESLKVSDPDIINAIRFHTVGRAGMSRLEEIVYMADLTSADRTYKDVDRMRKIARNDLNKAMLEALKFSMASVTEKNGFIPEYTVQAYNQYAYVMTQKKKEKDKKKNSDKK